jgi:hypothetical protein
MFIVTATYTRPNTSTPWFSQGDAFSQHFEANYRETGKCLESTGSISPDGLTIVRQATWASRSDFLEFIEDPQYQTLMANRDSHLAANGIVFTVERRLVNEQPPAQP